MAGACGGGAKDGGLDGAGVLMGTRRRRLHSGMFKLAEESMG